MTPSPGWANPAEVAGSAAEPVIELWNRLASGRASTEAMQPTVLGALPETVRRWLGHAVEPGALNARSVLLKMTGRIKVGRWLPFEARQVLSADGFVWAARAGWRALPIRGFDRFGDGGGEMRWVLGGRIPVVRAAGTDVSRSDAGRLAIEATIWLPTAAAGLDWRTGDDPCRAVAIWQIGNERPAVELHLDGEGRPHAVTMQRWGNPGREPYGYYPFGGLLEEERAFGGITIPTAIRVGWWPGTGRWERGEFFRARITDAAFL